MLHISCRETFHVSNMTQHDLVLQPGDPTEVLSSRLVARPGSTQPLAAVWTAARTATATTATAQAAQPAAAAGSSLSVAATAPSKAGAAAQAPLQPATWPCMVSLLLADPQQPCGQAANGRNASAPEGSGSPQERSAPKAACASLPAAVTASAVVSMAEPCGRRWLLLPAARRGGPPWQVAFRLQRTEGVHHLVIFDDQQPPLRLVNNAGEQPTSAERYASAVRMSVGNQEGLNLRINFQCCGLEKRRRSGDHFGLAQRVS